MTVTYYFGDSLTDQDNLFFALVDALQPAALQRLITPLSETPDAATLGVLTVQSRAIATQQAAQILSGFGPARAVTNEFTHPTYAAQIGNIQAVNFAVADARAVGEREPLGPGFDLNLGAQVDRYLDQTGGIAAEGSSAIFMIGSNDFADVLGALEDDPDSTADDLVSLGVETAVAVLTSLNAAVTAVSETGVSEIYLATLPLPSFFPSFDAGGPELLDPANQALSDYNNALTLLADGLQAAGINAKILDTSAVATAITEDPSSFGIIADRSVFSSAPGDFDSDQIGFFDSIHPAEAIQQAWGAYVDFALAGGETELLGAARDVAFADPGPQAIFGLAGDDVIYAGSDDVIVFSGSGDDYVFSGRGNDIVSGGSGQDRLSGGTGDDILSGGSDDDVIQGGWGDDVLVDGLGDDLTLGGRGDDIFVFTDPNLIGGDGADTDTFAGGEGRDTLYLVLTETDYATFNSGDHGTILSDLGIQSTGIERTIAINGRSGIEDALAEYDWFQTADFWGLVSAPTAEDAPT